MMTATDTISVLIVDDHRMFAESLSRLLADEDGITVLGIAGTVRETMELVGRYEPQIQPADDDAASRGS